MKTAKVKTAIARIVAESRDDDNIARGPYLTTSKIAEEIGCSRPTLTHVLDGFVEVGEIEKRPSGRYYVRTLDEADRAVRKMGAYKRAKAVIATLGSQGIEATHGSSPGLVVIHADNLRAILPTDLGAENV